MIVRSFLPPSLIVALTLTALASARPAQAQSIADCGNIYVEANASCEVDPPSINCDVACEPIRVQAACAGRAYVDCSGRCDVDIDVGCSASCEASCSGQCEIDPGKFDCQAYCQADCSGGCQAECATSGDKSRCEASCKATCSGDCAANCDIRAPSASCQAECKASCTGSCHAKANVDCQVMCQSDFYLQCEAQLSGGCKAECMSEQGALFCQGNYVDSGNNLEQCVEALRESLNVRVEGYAESDCDSTTNTCSAAAGGSASCSVLPGAERSSAGSTLLLMIAGLGAVLVTRRRAR